MLDVAPPDSMKNEDLRLFESSVDRFLQRAAPQERVGKWREAGQVELAFWREAGKAGFLGMMVPEEYGGPGADFRHEIVLADRLARHNVSGFGGSLHNVIVVPYVIQHGTHEQKLHWLQRPTIHPHHRHTRRKRLPYQRPKNIHIERAGGEFYRRGGKN
jgi:acyl-CoA dehydrogenase